ncbi:unnamed protein product, partial [Candidula unifasciata]
AKDGAGNQCCYNNDGTLSHSQLHVWGVYPYNYPGRVPELSHWRHDVSSFFYCCLWNEYELCDLYMELRPTTDCQNYDVPGIALTGVAVTEGIEKIEVSLALDGIKQRRALDIRVGGEIQYFLDSSSFWQDFRGNYCAIVNNAANVKDNRHDNFTILLTKTNVGITVVASHDLLQVTVAVPPNFKSGNNPNVVGLLGAYDASADNDFFNRQGQVISPARAKKEIYENFVLTWKILEDDYKLFRFYHPAENLDLQHSVFEYSQIPSNFSDAPTPYQVNQVCANSDNCKWDYKISGEEVVARATRDADDWLQNLERSASPVESCGFPEVGDDVTLSTENFTTGSEVKVTGCRNQQSLDSPVVFR